MRTGAKDLNEYLFAQLDALSNEDLTEGQLQTEIQRSKAICEVAKQINDSRETILKAIKIQSEYNGADKTINALIGVADE